MPGIWFEGKETKDLQGEDLTNKINEGKNLQFQLCLV